MDNDSFYKPSGTIKDTNRTYVPDMYRQVAAEMKEEENNQNVASIPTHVVHLQNRPLIGVLYSITIGSDLSSDICLRETSVSAQHGILLARKQTNAQGEEYINVILSDTNSSYGTCVNGERLSFEKVNCVDGDLISIGQNYVLILSLFNALDKLTVAYGFDRIPEPKTSEAVSQPLISPTENIIGGMQMNSVEDHSTNITRDTQEEASVDFYKPTKQQGQDHYNNKTIIL